MMNFMPCLALCTSPPSAFNVSKILPTANESVVSNTSNDYKPTAPAFGTTTTFQIGPTMSSNESVVSNTSNDTKPTEPAFGTTTNFQIGPTMSSTLGQGQGYTLYGASTPFNSCTTSIQNLVLFLLNPLFNILLQQRQDLLLVCQACFLFALALFHQPNCLLPMSQWFPPLLMAPIQH
nr:uncharacterized protein LOC125418257 isoform X2 [Ziziphus jujuba var. spinosa]